MRPLLPPDLDILVRFLLAHAPVERTVLTFGLLDQADIADRYRKRTGRCHPVFGDGSVQLLARAGGTLSPPAFCDAEYLACLETMVAAIRDWRAEREVHRLS